ncbi:MAG: ABC transporter permease [Bacteroidetes bacterium HGW-Bacteroidetes-1]|jgi:peptide/nickel transport system permease protein|nr:MAG: ABC transporter permease [Bacteroidetes bacterium HGW-Bacteroidetes-1]
MSSFMLRRFYYGLLVLLGVLTVVFVLFAILPGDPARMIMGQRTDQKMIDAIRKDLGLDQPLLVQYLLYINDISPVSLHNATDPENIWFFDQEKYKTGIQLVQIKNTVIALKKPYLRRSWQSRREVSDILVEAFPKTLLLASVSILIAMIAGLIIGSITAIINKPFLNRIVLVITVFGMSLPSFFAAILIAWIFAFLLAEYTGLSMFGSLYSVDDFGNGEYLDLKNLILPAITLGIRPLAIVVELTRTSLLEVLSQDYIRTAYAKGLKKWRVVVIHALKNALNPVITAISGWFASLLAGAVFVEYVFDWKGIGVVIVDALEKYDLPVLMGSVLLIAFILIIINIFVDIVYGVLDPRVRIANKI